MKTKKFLSGLALGAMLGSALGLFFNPTTGKKNRAKFKAVSKQLSEKLIKEVSRLSNLSKKEYELIVENLVKKYHKNDLLNKEAWEEIAAELKLRWVDIQKELKKTQKKAKPVAKKSKKK